MWHVWWSRCPRTMVRTRMVDEGSWASSDSVRSTMRANRSRDTGPELRLRSMLHRRGLRFRVDHEPVRGFGRRADLVFSRAQVAVFVHGCFWHGCPEHYVAPKSNSEYWTDKLHANRSRDQDTIRRVREIGWTPIVVWEHDDLVSAADHVEAAVRSAAPRRK